MKSVLIILTQKDQHNLQVNESIAALMLLASFNLSISVLFKDAALSLLAADHVVDDQLKQFLKPAYKMVESFEFYDIEKLCVLEQDRQYPLLADCVYQLHYIELNSQFIQQFDHVLTW